MRAGRARYALVLALIAAVLCGCTSSQAGGRAHAADPARPAADPLQVGISYGDVLPYLSTDALDTALNDAVYVGASWIRLDLAWDDIQPTPGAYSWGSFDRVVAAARARHLSLLPILAYTPAFARPPGCDSDKCGPVNPAAFAAFAAAAVRRYAPMGIHDWEIWNEPNSENFWQPSPDPAKYAELVRLTAAAIRSAQPGATVILGSMAAGKLPEGGIVATTFLQDLCTLGVNKLVNAIGWHPYSYPELPSSADPHNPWNEISADSPNFEAILAKAGTPHLPVWITEYGAPTSGPGAAASSPQHPPGVFPAYVTQAFQARLARVAVTTAQANPDVAALFWFTDQDTPGPASDRGDYFGLRTASGSPKPALAALRQAVSQLPGH
jgi:hypothetical protein